MEHCTIAELSTASHQLTRSLLDLKAAQLDCAIAEMELQITIQITDLAIVQVQQTALQIAQTRHQLEAKKLGVLEHAQTEKESSIRDASYVC